MIKHVHVSIAVALSTTFAIPTVLAACEKGAVTVFACMTAHGKRIEVCDSGKTIDYSFGYPNQKPEIVVRASREQASTWQWRGVGRAMSYSVDVPNGNTVYRVFWGLDRLSATHQIEAGVQVEIARKHAATVNCMGENHIVQNIEGIKLKPSE